MNGMYEELLEKLRKNNRMSGWTHIDRLIDEAAEAIEALQAENEQLQAQLDEWKYEAKCHMDKDCKHYNTTGCSVGFGWCESMDRGVSDEFFCFCGAKLEGKPCE